MSTMPCKACRAPGEVQACLYCGHAFCARCRVERDGAPACAACAAAEGAPAPALSGSGSQDAPRPRAGSCPSCSAAITDGALTCASCHARVRIGSYDQFTAVTIWAEEGIILPRSCACCGATDDLGQREYRARRQYSRGMAKEIRIGIPLCTTCLGHASSADRRDGLGFLLISALGVAVGFGATRLDPGWGALIGLALGGLAVVGSGVWFLSAGARDPIADALLPAPKLTPTCATYRQPCRLRLDCDGFLVNLRYHARFSFARREYAALFAQVNHRLRRT